MLEDFSLTFKTTSVTVDIICGPKSLGLKTSLFAFEILTIPVH